MLWHIYNIQSSIINHKAMHTMVYVLTIAPTIFKAMKMLASDMQCKHSATQGW